MCAISGIIITLNEENNIAEAILSLQQICDEIIVVDSESTDNTVAIATGLGAKVIISPYSGDGIQKNKGITEVTHDWIFCLDADERIMPELANMINTLDLHHSQYAGYAVRRRNFIGDRWIRCCGWYPDYVVRLFNRHKTRYAASKQHAAVPFTHCFKLKADLLHYSYHHIGELFAKPNRNFSTRSAKILFLKGKKVTVFAPFCHGLWAFIVNYFFKKGIFSGLDGLTLALSMAQNSYLKYAKLIEYYRDKTVRNNENFEEVW
ncbi:MAG: glycosyltransferase family 2 protein [Bacteroidales bacterium]|jgi:glycosyltransferase involved in cell wall biosynthesis|nr:glycosyltransferase family 2 protein [Bacteroidales bacterium]